MIELIKQLPDQIEAGLKLDVPTPKTPDPYGRTFICGMGGSAAAGAVASCFFPDRDIRVIRDYALPGYLREKDLVIAISYSGNTEETLSCYREALSRRAQLFFISSDGQLAELARQNNIQGVIIPSGLPPRAALGWLFTPLIRILVKAGFGSPEIEQQMAKLPDFLRLVLEELQGPESQSFDMANRFYNRIPVIYTSQRFKPIGLRWCAQINENSKSIAHCASLPEMDHNEVSGLVNPRDIVEEMWLVFLNFPEDHPRVSARARITADILQDSVMGTTQVQAKGENTLERVFWTLLLGDMISYYLALNYQEDPFAIPRIDVLKARLRDIPW